MKTARDIYGDVLDSEYLDLFEYQPMLNEIGNILIQVDDEDYQGDTRILYEKNGRYGYLIFGWGSCSGCDALQACDTEQEVQALFDGLVNKVVWFDSLELLKDYFNSKDWGLEYCWHEDETRNFIEKVKNYESNNRNR